MSWKAGRGWEVNLRRLPDSIASSVVAACIENAFSHTECLWIILLTSLHPDLIHQGRIKELLSICTNYKLMHSAEISPRGYYNNSIL